MRKPKYKLGQKIWGVKGSEDEVIGILGKITKIIVSRDGIEYVSKNEVGSISNPINEENIMISPEEVRDDLLKCAKKDYEEEANKINKAYKKVEGMK